MIEIRHRHTGAVLRTVDAETPRGAGLRSARLREADLREADLHDSDLHCADLLGADLRGADLRGADLLGADLRRADLRGADLLGADLRGADLRGANLEDANLEDANLEDANLEDANLTEATLPNGETFEQFVQVTVPRLLLKAERPDRYAAAVAAWDCHEWENCPLHAARGVSAVDELPEAERPCAKLFLDLFEGRALARPEVTP